MVEKATMDSKTETTSIKSIKTVSGTDVKSDLAFCLGPPVEKTNSGSITYFRAVRGFGSENI